MGLKRNRNSNSCPDDELLWGIVAAVADARDVEPLELDERLYDVVDPDALGRLFADRPDGTPRGSGYVTFTLAQCEVTVDSQRRVSVSPRDDSAAD